MRLRLIPLFIVPALILGMADACQSAETIAERDLWYVTSDGKTDYASIHQTVKQMPDGHYEYRSERRVLVEFLGQAQELKQTSVLEVNADLAPIACHAESQSRSGKVTVTGRVDGDEFLVTSQRGDLTFTRRFPLKERLIFLACLPDQLTRVPSDQASPTFLTLDEDLFLIQQVTAKRKANEGDLQIWDLQFQNSPGSGVWKVTGDGLLQSAETIRPRMVHRIADAEQAAAIQHRKMPDRELLIFPLKENISFPDRLKSLTVRLRWKGDSFDSLNLEDLHQKIIRHEVQEGVHEIDLRLTKPSAEQLSAARDPLAKTPDSAFLAETTFICPHDPSIQKQARNWTTGAKSPLDVTRKLTQEVSNYLQGGDLIAETLTGPEVLACRKGKCSEYSTLLASLTRSQNIPTRVALGMRLVGGQWVGHMWCEVWAGEWIPVDATANEIGGSPALLKLTHSASVMGTQEVRFAATEFLDLEFLEFEKDPENKTNLKTEIVGRSYTNGEFGCRITAPAENWKLEDKSKSGVVTVRFHVPGDFEKRAPQVHFVAFSLPSALDPSILVNARKTRMMFMLKDFKVLVDEKFPVNKLNSRRFVFQYTTPKTPDRITKNTEYLWTDGRAGYLLNLIADESIHDDMVKDVEKLLHSFEQPDPPKEDPAKK